MAHDDEGTALTYADIREAIERLRLTEPPSPYVPLPLPRHLWNRLDMWQKQFWQPVDRIE